MPRMHPTTRLLTTIATLGFAAVVVAPALADERGPATAERPSVAPRFAFGRVGEWARRAEARQSALAGPFVPVVGGADRGTAENAFGAARSGHTHAGQDLFAAAGTPLVAVDDGVVIEAGTDAGQGNFVHLYDPARDRTYVYMHLVGPATVRTGERVGAGRRLGGIGCTGSCWGDHLHFEVRAGRGYEGEARDPLPALRRWQRLERPL